MHHSPAPIPDPSSPEGINEAIRQLAGVAARAGEWTPMALEELHQLYRRWDAVRGAEGDEAQAA